MSSDLEGFAEVVGARQASLVRLAYALCGDWATAEDCVAAALTRVWPAWRRGRVRDLDPYLRRAVLNEVASWHRWRFRERARLGRVPLPVDAVPGPEEGAAGDDWIRRRVLGLPLPQRQVVVLRYLEDRSEAEIADLLGVAVGTVKSRLHRAMMGLRADIAAGGTDDG
jgi:RNA polymerase sigma-70 factor (sigma-E family)